ARRHLVIMQLPLLPPELLVDTSQRTTAGIRIGLPNVAEPLRPTYGIRKPPKPAPNGMPDPLRAHEYVVVDVEATGSGHLRAHRITEIAAMRVNRRGEVIGEHESLASQDRPIPSFVPALTSVTYGSANHALRVNGRGEVIGAFESLVNPDRPIPSFVSALTNITYDMVKDAPRFWEIAPRVYELLDGAVFVAHNVQFDWAFVREEMRRASAP